MYIEYLRYSSTEVRYLQITPQQFGHDLLLIQAQLWAKKDFLSRTLV